MYVWVVHYSVQECDRRIQWVVSFPMCYPDTVYHFAFYSYGSECARECSLRRACVTCDISVWSFLSHLSVVLHWLPVLWDSDRGCTPFQGWDGSAQGKGVWTMTSCSCVFLVKLISGWDCVVVMSTAKMSVMSVFIWVIWETPVGLVFVCVRKYKWSVGLFHFLLL